MRRAQPDALFRITGSPNHLAAGHFHGQYKLMPPKTPQTYKKPRLEKI
jgi:hypothetical protein